MTTLPKKDVVLIGYGAAAGPMSAELSKAGYSVLALERGEYRDLPDFAPSQFDTLRFVNRKEMVPSVSDFPLTFRQSEDEVAKPMRHVGASTVGGASVHWSGQSWRYYEDDFRVKSTIEEMYSSEQLAYLKEDGANIQDWPITYDDLEPFYEKTEVAVGIGGFAGNIQGEIRPVNPDEGNPFEAPRQNDFPMRPLRDNAVDLTFREGALALGLKPFHVATAITTEPYTNPDGVERAACTYCPFCTSHGCWNHSKGSSLAVHLPTAEASGNFELRSQCHVLKINHEGGRAISVDYIDLASGQLFTQPADFFYLGSYSFGNVRLLLHSGLDGNGQVGKYFINRSGASVSAVFGDRYINGYAGPAVQRQGIDDYNGENAFELKNALPLDKFFIRGSFIGSPSQRNPLESYQMRPADVPNWGLGYKQFFTENLNRMMQLQILSEPIPYESSYMDLDPNYVDKYGVPALRIHRQAKQNEQRMAEFMYERGVEIMQAAGATQVWGNPKANASGAMTHDCGGLRMGDDPTMSVTNKYGQMWSVPNILVGGGGLLPTMSGHNPTETIWTLAYWTADAVINNKIDFSDSQAFV